MKPQIAININTKTTHVYRSATSFERLDCGITFDSGAGIYEAVTETNFDITDVTCRRCAPH